MTNSKPSCDGQYSLGVLRSFTRVYSDRRPLRRDSSACGERCPIHTGTHLSPSRRHSAHPHHTGPFPDKGQLGTAAHVLEHWLKAQEAGRLLHKLGVKKRRNSRWCQLWWSMLYCLKAPPQQGFQVLKQAMLSRLAKASS